MLSDVFLFSNNRNTMKNVVTKRRLEKAESLARNPPVFMTELLCYDLTNMPVPVSEKNIPFTRALAIQFSS